MSALIEVLALPVRFLADLPIHTTLVAQVGGRTLWLTTSRDVAAYALAVGLADGVLTPTRARAELDRKLAAPAYRIVANAILGTVRHPDRRAMGGGQGLTFRELLEALGVELVDVQVHAVAAAESEAA